MKNQTLFKVYGTFILPIIFLTSSFAQFNWMMDSANKERTSYAKSENELYPPFQDTSLIWIWVDDLAFYDSKIYYGANGGPNQIAAFDYESQEHLWFYDVENSYGSIGFVPTISEEIVLGGGQDCTGLHGINRHSGEREWFKEMDPIYSNEPIIDQNKVYIGNDSLYCLDLLTGETLWSKALSVYFPVVDESNLYIGNGNKIYAFDKITGVHLWEQTSNYYYGCVNESNFFSAGPEKIQCHNKLDGSMLWEYPVNDVYLFGSGMAIDENYLVFTVWANADNKSRICVLDLSDGQKVWEHLFDVEGCYEPTIANGVVYTASWSGGKFWGFDISSGEILFEDDSNHYYGQAMVANHSLFIQTVNGLIEFGMDQTNALNELDEVIDLVVYPNPFKDIIRLELTSSLKDKKITIYDINGVRILNHKATPKRIKDQSTIEICTENWQPGIYFLIIRSGPNSQSQRIVKH